MAENRVCQGYAVIDSIHIGDEVEVVLAHNPNAPSPYVTWKTYAYSQFQDFYHGCYFSDEEAARENFWERADDARKYLPPGHRDKKPQHRKRPSGRDR